MRNLLVLFLSACALPHVPPKPRNAFAESYTRVRVQVTCGERSAFKRPKEDMPHEYEPPIEWAPPADATGVIISERHVLTAAHVVRCPIIPTVHVILADGRRFKMMVEKDDVQFGHGEDLARLEMRSANTFATGIAPPELATASTGPWCAETLRGEVCGTPLGDTFSAITHKGDSGAAVYDTAGRLVGLVVSGSTQSTGIVRVTSRWLEGT